VSTPNQDLRTERVKRCPLLAIAMPYQVWRLAPPEMDCLEASCALWNENLGVCGLVAQGHILGVEVSRAEAFR